MVRMPFAKVVEAHVIASGGSKESLKRTKDISHNANESPKRAAFSLNGKFFHSKRVRADMLSHQYAADLATAGFGKSGCHSVHEFRRKQELHCRIYSATRLGT
jgi:hypothetical protein